MSVNSLPADQELSIPASRGQSIYLERQTWSAAEHRAAAGALGTEAMHAAQTYLAMCANPRFQDDFARGLLSGMQSKAIDLARQAAHYAHCALAMDEVEAGTLNGVVR